MTDLYLRGGIRSRLTTGTADTERLNWWGRRWIETLGDSIDHARYTRGKSCAKRGRVISLEIEPGLVSALVQGERTKTYMVRFGFNTLSGKACDKVLARFREHAIFAAYLLAGKLPHETEDVFREAGIRLFPTQDRLNTFKCTCPSEEPLCDHTIAVYMLLGEAFSNDPFLLLALYGFNKQSLIKNLSGAADETEETGRNSAPEKIIIEPVNEKDKYKNWFGTNSFKIPDVRETKKPEAYGVMHEFPFWRGANPFLETVKEYYAKAADYAYELLTGERRLLVGRPKKFV